MKTTPVLVLVLITILIQGCESKAQIIPQDFIGTWDRSESTCSDKVSLERLIISAKTVQYWESLGAVISVNKISTTEIDVKLSIKDEAEDRLESPRYRFNTARSKLIEVFADGSTFARVRCE